MIYDHKGNPIYEESEKPENVVKSMISDALGIIDKDKDEGHRIYVKSPKRFINDLPTREDITILPADDPKNLRMGWVIHEEIGVAVINNYATAKIVIPEARFKSVKRSADPLVEIEDFIDERYWPEWEVEITDDEETEKYTVQAPTQEKAEALAKRLWDNR